MPRTVRASLVPFGDVIQKPSPTVRSCSFAQPSSTIAPSLPSDAGTRSSPCFQSNRYRSPMVFVSTELTTSLSPNASAPSWWMAVTAFTPGVRASVLATFGSVGEKPSAPGTTFGAAIRARDAVGARAPPLERALRRVAQPVGDDGDERDEGDADRQRHRGDRRP